MSNGKNFTRVLFSIFVIGFFACFTLTLLRADDGANVEVNMAITPEDRKKSKAETAKERAAIARD